MGIKLCQWPSSLEIPCPSLRYSYSRCVCIISILHNVTGSFMSNYPTWQTTWIPQEFRGFLIGVSPGGIKILLHNCDMGRFWVSMTIPLSDSLPHKGMAFYVYMAFPRSKNLFSCPLAPTSIWLDRTLQNLQHTWHYYYNHDVQISDSRLNCHSPDHFWEKYMNATL